MTVKRKSDPILIVLASQESSFKGVFLGCVNGDFEFEASKKGISWVASIDTTIEI